MSIPHELEINRLVAVANGNQAAIEKGGMAVVTDLVTRNDVVFGVWQDFSQRGGVATMIVTRKSRLLAIIEEEAPEELGFTAIPCTCAEQAEALKRVLGDGALS